MMRSDNSSSGVTVAGAVCGGVFGLFIGAVAGMFLHTSILLPIGLVLGAASGAAFSTTWARARHKTDKPGPQ